MLADTADTAADICARWVQLEGSVTAPLLRNEPPAFGAVLRRELFPRLGGSTGLLPAQPTDTYLNQGGTGMVMEPVLSLRGLVGRLAEEQPMTYHREIAPALMLRARSLVSEYLGAGSPNTLSFMASASSGFYAALRAMALVPGDVIMTTSLRYHSFNDDLRRYCDSRGVRIVTVALPLPLTSLPQVRPRSPLVCSRQHQAAPKHCLWSRSWTRSRRHCQHWRRAVRSRDCD